jgi:23S rRNA (cytosine1962-C5)-methyltransferase
MLILTPNKFLDYKLLDSGEGERLEQFGEYVLRRPDPQIIWQKSLPQEKWQSADATFIRTHEDKGNWKIKSKLSGKWLMSWQDLKFFARLAPFKHTGVFPEQAAHWEWLKQILDTKSDTDQPKVLNLFGYTGIASLVAAKAGASVTHVDASFPTIGQFKENIEASNLQSASVRYIEDDVLKFCERELRRGNRYEGILMDPPSFGHGPNGETWKFNEHFPKLIKICTQLLSERAQFVIVNAYAISSSALTLENVLKDNLSALDGTIESGELALQEESSGKLLSTGIFARWSSSKRI